MKYVPFAIIKSAQKYDPEAVNHILKHFEGYIASQCLMHYEDDYGHIHSYVDEDLRYQGEIGLYSAIFKFCIHEPPDDFSA